MKKLIFVLALVLGTAVCAGAQDLITTVRGDTIKAKVVEVGPETVSYKRIDNPNGPVYTTRLSEIRSILYESGYLERYNEPSLPGIEEPSRKPVSVSEVRYRDIEGMYNTDFYVERPGDPYIPVLSGLGSFFLPGLGQCIDGEWARGLGIAAANVGFFLLEVTEGAAMAYNAASSGYYYIYDDPYSYRGSRDLTGIAAGALAVTALAQMAFNIWNIYDAVHIAKVKNMYYHDIRGDYASMDLRLEPHLALAPGPGSSFQPTAGLSLKVSF